MATLALAAERTVMASPETVFGLFGAGAGVGWVFDAVCDRLEVGAVVGMRGASGGLGGGRGWAECFVAGPPRGGAAGGRPGGGPVDDPWAPFETQYKLDPRHTRAVWRAPDPLTTAVWRTILPGLS